MVKIIAHRGVRKEFPENTIKAFDRAEEICDGFEFDVQKSSDGYYLVIHDETVDRTSDGKGAVSELTREEMKSFDFGKQEKIPDLSEMRNYQKKDFLINLELKEETLKMDDYTEISEIIETSGNLIVSSFNPRLIINFKKNGYQTGLLYNRDDIQKHLFRCIFLFFRIKPDYIHLPNLSELKLTGRAFQFIYRFFRFFRTGVLYWNINSLEDFKTIYPHLDICISDEPELLKKYLYSLH